MGFLTRRSLPAVLKNAALENYGTAARAFIEAVADGVGEVSGAAKQCAKSFTSEHCREDSDYQVRRAAFRFGFVAPAGELAIASDILPWPEGEATKSAELCFEAWLVARGNVHRRQCGLFHSGFYLCSWVVTFQAAWEPPALMRGRRQRLSLKKNCLSAAIGSI
jgi:hypothetical protein